MTTNIDQHPHPLEGRLESECGNFKYPMECAVLSAAISLKRIADQLDGSGVTDRAQTGVADVLNALPYFLNRWGGPNP